MKSGMQVFFSPLLQQRLSESSPCVAHRPERLSRLVSMGPNATELIEDGGPTTEINVVERFPAHITKRLKTSLPKLAGSKEGKDARSVVKEQVREGTG